MGFRSVAQAGLKLLLFPHPIPECRGHSHGPPCLPNGPHFGSCYSNLSPTNFFLTSENTSFYIQRPRYGIQEKYSGSNQPEGRLYWDSLGTKLRLQSPCNVNRANALFCPQQARVLDCLFFLPSNTSCSRSLPAWPMTHPVLTTCRHLLITQEAG